VLANLKVRPFLAIFSVSGIHPHAAELGLLAQLLGAMSEPASAGKVRFGSGSGAFFPNAEPEPCVRFSQSVNPEPEHLG
jgi:hypothetical protein